MSRGIKITVIVCLLWVLVVLFITYQRYAGNNNSAGVSSEDLREVGAVLYEQPVAISDFELLDHHRRPFTKNTLDGQWTLVFFGFTNCPDICPLTMHELTGFYRDLDGDPMQNDTQVVMISVDPFRDDTDQIAGYMRGFHPDFLGVNGDFNVISRLARELFISHGIMPLPDDEGGSNNFLIDHSGNILLIDPQGQYRGFLEPNIKRANIGEAYRLIRANG